MNKLAKFKALCKKNQIQLAFLFGSQAQIGYDLLCGRKKSSFDKLGDLDLGIVFLSNQVVKDIERRLNLYGILYEELSTIFSPLELDLVFLEETDYLIQYAAINGINIFKASDIALADYVEKVTKLAADWSVEVRLFQQEVMEAIRDGQITVEYNFNPR